MGATQVELLGPGDWPAVRRIFDAGIATATFETTIPSRASLDAHRLPGQRSVAEVDDTPGEVVDWTALSPCPLASATLASRGAPSTSPAVTAARVSTSPHPPPGDGCQRRRSVDPPYRHIHREPGEHCPPPRGDIAPGAVSSQMPTEL